MAKRMAALILAFVGVAVAISPVGADVSVNGVRVQGGGNEVRVTTGSVASDVEMEGIAVINGEVFIDGAKVARGKTLYTSKKSGKTYRIDWGKDGNVSVSEK